MANDPTKCRAKHTQYNPPPEEFRCPECNAESGVFAVDETAENADPSCERLHAKDGLRCYDCRHEMSGASFARSRAKAANLVPCPTCKGHGMVDVEKAQGAA